MSKEVLKPDIYALQQSVVDVLSQVRDLMSYASERLESLDSKDRRYTEHSKSIENEINKVKNLELRMAIAAPMKAGKSTIINAIVGQDILPSRNSAMTTLPTEIVFSKEVTEPKLRLNYDDADTYAVLGRSWAKLHQKVYEIGREQARQAIAEYPHLQSLLEDITDNSEITFGAEVSGTEAIQKTLTDLNDLVRLCGVLVPSENPLMSLVSVPRIEVPFLQAQSSLNLDSVGKLVIVDTPGPNEAGDLKLENVVKLQLQASSIILLVLDYTQLNAEAAEKVKRDVDEVSEIKGKDSIYILVNKIDLRKSKADMTKEQVLEFVHNKFGIEGSSDRVFEISASRAAYASNFLGELRLNPNIDNPQSMDTAELLARQAFGDMWEDEFPEASMDRMTKAADRIWSKSGFADFLEKAIGVLMAQAAPLTLSWALNDASSRLKDLQNNTNLQKSAFGQDIQKLQGQIDQLEDDLRKLTDSRNNLKKQIENLCKELDLELNNSFYEMQKQSRKELKKIFVKHEMQQQSRKELKKTFVKHEFYEPSFSERPSFTFTRFITSCAVMLSLLKEVDYQGTEKIEFKYASIADRFVERATASAKIIVNDLMFDARESAWGKLQISRNRIQRLIKTETKPIIEQAQRRLEKQFDIKLEIPDIFSEVEIGEDIDLIIESKYSSRQFTDYKTAKERRWYTIWLWEHEKKVPITRIEGFYTVSIEEINKTVEQSIKKAVGKVKKRISSYLQEDFLSVLNNFYDELDNFLKSYEESLQQSVDVGKQSAEQQAAHKLALDKISDDSAKLKGDVDNQKKYVKEIMPNKN